VGEGREQDPPSPPFHPLRDGGRESFVEGRSDGLSSYFLGGYLLHFLFTAFSAKVATTVVQFVEAFAPKALCQSSLCIAAEEICVAEIIHVALLYVANCGLLSMGLHGLVDTA
jgi:hypothetical protein